MLKSLYGLLKKDLLNSVHWIGSLFVGIFRMGLISTVFAIFLFIATIKVALLFVDSIYLLLIIIGGRTLYHLVKYIFLEERNKFVNEKIKGIALNVFQEYEQKFIPLKEEDFYIGTPSKLETLPHTIKMHTLDEKDKFYEDAFEEMKTIHQQFLSLSGSFSPLKSPNSALTHTLQDLMLGSSKQLPFPALNEYQYLFNNLVSLVKEASNYYEVNFKIIRTGVVGEERMEKELLSFHKGSDFKMLSNAVLEYKGKSFETDFLLFSKYGIFSLEVKNIGEAGNFKINISPDGLWMKVNDRGKATPMQDISSQVNFHLSMTENILSEYTERFGIKTPEVKPVIILANNNVILENNAGLPIFRISQFIHYMRGQEEVMNDSLKEDLFTFFHKFQVDTKKYETIDYLPEFRALLNNFTKSYDNHVVFIEMVNEIERRVEKDFFLKKFKGQHFNSRS